MVELFVFHDISQSIKMWIRDSYMGYQEEVTVYELPWEYECSDDSESDLTLEQYNAIVSLAEWQDEELVKPIE